MTKWTILHRVRYPPFDDKRIHPKAAPISEKVIEANLTKDEVMRRLPPYKISSPDGWLIERIIEDENGKGFVGTTKKLEDDGDFVKLVGEQRTGWYILPNNLHRYSRNMVSGAVILLLSTLVYLFIEPILSELGIPSIGTKSVQVGLLDYPILSIIVVPVLMLPIVLRIIANFIDLKRQQDFFRSPVRQPSVSFSLPIVSGESLDGTIQIPEKLPGWTSMTAHLQVGTLPPSRDALIKISETTEHSQPPVGLSTPLPHHWESGLDDGTAGGEDSPLERQDIQGGVFLRPMRFSAQGGQAQVDEDGSFSIPPPQELWPGTVNTGLHRIHWEFILKIKREKQMPLLWVCPIRVRFPNQLVHLENLDINDPRTEQLYIGIR